MVIRKIAFRVAAVVVLSLSVSAASGGQTRNPATPLDRAFQQYWAAATPAASAKAIDRIVATGATFDEVLGQLKKGRPYRREKPGIRYVTHRVGGKAYTYRLEIPARYDPSRRYPVRVQLHGDVHARGKRRDAGIRPFADPNAINVIPYASGAPWWTEDQLRNLHAILNTLKRRFNIDENRVTLAGESDGGTGAYFIAMRDPTPFASFLPLNAFIMVLGNEGWALNERIFPNNLRNKPLLVVNGGRDPLYSTERVDSYIKHMRANGVRIDYHPQPDAGHDLQWWPMLKDTIEQFITDHPRDPLPDRLTWERAEEDGASRIHWLVIDELIPSDADQADQAPAGPARFSLRRGGPNPYPLFAFQAPAGRADVARNDNTVAVSVEGVSDLTLLLSPDRIDFRQPVTITVNDEVVFDDMMVPDVRMLLKWAAVDNDRTMLFGAEFRVHLE